MQLSRIQAWHICHNNIMTSCQELLVLGLCSTNAVSCWPVSRSECLHDRYPLVFVGSSLASGRNVASVGDCRSTLNKRNEGFSFVDSC